MTQLCPLLEPKDHGFNKRKRNVPLKMNSPIEGEEEVMKLKDIKMHPTSGLATHMYMAEVENRIKKGELFLEDDDLLELLKVASWHVYRAGWVIENFSGKYIRSSLCEAIEEAEKFLLAIGLPREKIIAFSNEEWEKFMKAVS